MSVSVIIPVKNRALLLRQTLKNVLAQSLKPYEIIVVDDHSDESLEEIKFEFKHDVIFLLSNGHGPGAARNTGFNYSSGKYIQFFDSDDLISFDKLEVQQKILESTGAGMCYCTYVKAREISQVEWKQLDDFMYFYPIPGNLRYDQQVLRGANMIIQACLFTRELLNIVGPWREDLITHEDLEYLFRVGQVEAYPKHTNIPFVVYRQHVNQITDKDVSIERRHKDALKAHEIISQSVMNSFKYSLFDRIYIKTSIIHDLFLLEKYDYKTTYKVNYVLYICYYIIQIKKKIYHKMHKTKWSKYNGVSNDRTLFKNYIFKVFN
jgi:hypothetical protein